MESGGIIYQGIRRQHQGIRRHNIPGYQEAHTRESGGIIYQGIRRQHHGIRRHNIPGYQETTPWNQEA